VKSKRQSRRLGSEWMRDGVVPGPHGPMHCVLMRT